MSQPHLVTYLNDHLAGSTLGIELLDHIASAYGGTRTEQFARGLRKEIVADREELEAIMARLDIGQSATRKASAWVAEKLAQLKLKLDDPAAGAFRLQEALEAVSLGIEGKRLLWAALATASETAAELRGNDYARLRQRAEDQRSRVEVVRLEAAKSALALTA